MKKANNEIITSEIRRQIGEIRSLGWYHSLRLPTGKLIPGLQTEEQLRWRIAQFPIPEDLTGKRVLDIGAWDGWFTFEMERRGAEVVAIDLVDDTRFREARELMGSRAEYYIEDITYLTPAKYGTFDIVLFFGVLYHLKHPLLAIERVCELSRDLVCLESFVSDEVPDGPVVMEFYEGEELAGQFDNWCGPSISCFMAFCRTAGFAEVTFESVRDHRAHLTGQRLWKNTKARGALEQADGGTGPAPTILCCENTVFQNHQFIVERDDYVSIWFRLPGPAAAPLTPDDVFVQVGDFGIRPAKVRPADSSTGDGWHASCKVPLGLAPGWHNISVAVNDGSWSPSVPIPVGRTRPGRPWQLNGISIEIIADGKTWDRNQIHTGTECSMSVWVRSLPDDLRAQDLFLEIAGTLHPVTYLSGPDPAHNGARQMNAILPTRLPAGQTEVAIVVGNTRSEPRKAEIVRSR